MTRYEQMTRVERVRVQYTRGVCIEEGAESKVYRVSTKRYPSGERVVFLVWSSELGRCVWVRAEDVLVLAMSIKQIHTY